MQRGQTPLHLAARKDSYTVVMLLLIRAADVNARNNASFDAWR
jgi:ankyrin repeat protein